MTATAPTGEQAAFLRAIAADPREDTPRLAYADWLDENGEPERAALVRAQVELARAPEPPKHRHNCKPPRGSVLCARCEWLLVHGEAKRLEAELLPIVEHMMLEELVRGNQ